jgi:2-polyprenyl-6-hydroxyphenyl methylase/3-demethylubiquinone-9 3-methyltransferase
MTSTTPHNPTIDHFNDLADHWWDPQGPLKTLHTINPFRVQYIRQQSQVSARRILDVGCGGGILTEALARLGGNANGIDLAPDSIRVAQQHATEQQLDIHYRCMDINDCREDDSYDVVCCMELLEHVSEPAQLVEHCVRLCQPGGDLFFSTINRTAEAFIKAIIGAEYVCGLIPKGTHQYAQFIKPSELNQWLSQAGARSVHVQGFHYAPFTGMHRLCDNVQINYLLHAKKI